MSVESEFNEVQMWHENGRVILQKHPKKNVKFIIKAKKSEECQEKEETDDIRKEMYGDKLA